jgi:hypothetical protein
MKPKVLVIGGGGYLEAVLVERLLDEGVLGQDTR